MAVQSALADNPGGFGKPGGGHVVRLRGLPWSATEDDVREFFAGLQIVSIHLTFDHLGRPSGEGFVEFTDDGQTQMARLRDKGMMKSRWAFRLHFCAEGTIFG